MLLNVFVNITFFVGSKKKGKQERRKKTKFDPLQRKTVTQLQEELEQREGQSCKS